VNAHVSAGELAGISREAPRYTTGKNVSTFVKIGDLENRRREKNGETLRSMKQINRIALGTLSSILLSAGMTRAAQHLDPLSNTLGSNDKSAGCKTEPCAPCLPCNYQVD
jgi:hypothetical protein